MNTFILFWNPEISSYTLERLRNDLDNWAHVSNWSVWQHNLANIGDRFFMVRCGEGKTGICMSGRFCSEPYRDEDWSGKGREVYYMDLLADTVIDPDFLPILSTDELSKQIPSFEWSGGHSGQLLPGKEAKKLEKLWAEFLEEKKQIFHRHTYQYDISKIDFEHWNDLSVVGYIRFTDKGQFEITTDDEGIAVEGNNLDSLKQLFIEKVHNEEDGKSSSITIGFEFDFVDDQQLFERVLSIAEKAYEGMIDDEGNSYFRKALCESSPFYSENHIMVALLKDIFVNPAITPQHLIEQGVPKPVVDTATTLYLKSGEKFEHYIHRVAESPSAVNILIEMLEMRLNILEMNELSEEKYEWIAQNLKAYHFLNETKNENTAVFNGLAKDFARWFRLNECANVIAISGEYSDEDLAVIESEMSLNYTDICIDISELNTHREANFDHLIRTYEDDILSKLTVDDEEILLLEKMILNRKYSNVFEITGGKVFCSDKKVLVHSPQDQIIEIPDTVEIIGKCAAIRNHIVVQLDLPANVRNIDDYAFAHCEKLVQVSLHDGIKSIGRGCFYMCEIEQLRLSQSLSEIPDDAFAYNNIEHLEIPSNVKRIGAEAFFCNSGLDDSLIIPEGVETIEYAAFTDCFKHVTLPSTLKEIAYDFYYEEMIDDPVEMMPYVEIHPDNPVFYSKGGKLFRRDTGEQVLGNNNLRNNNDT